MTKEEALDIAMKEYAQTHYPDDCKSFKQGYEAGWTNAEQNVAISYLSERHFCPRCGKRLMGALGPVSLHTCCPPTASTGWDNGLSQDYDKKLGAWFSEKPNAKEELRARMFDEYGNKLP